MRPESLIFSCEHATNRIPAAYRRLFHGAAAELRSHCGWDHGALRVATALANHFRAPLFAGKASRLLIDLNRSLHHPRVFSERTRRLSTTERKQIVDRHYAPYRAAVEASIRNALAGGGRVVHVSVHSFTPIWNGERRSAEIGLLYDPGRPFECHVAATWKSALLDVAPQLRVRRNYPYRGTSDGFSVALRQTLRTPRYACIELEINQSILRDAAARRLQQRLGESLDRVLAARQRNS